MIDDSDKPDQADIVKSFIDIAVEAWHIGQDFDKLLTKIDAEEQDKNRHRLRHFQTKLEESLADMEMGIVDVKGEEFDPGMAVTALNIGEFGPDDVLIVDRMLEPIIMGPGGVVARMGTVMLRRERS